MSVPPKVAEALGMAMPEENEEVVGGELVVVEPHEIVDVRNPDLPYMGDTDGKIVEAEKQLEELIVSGMTAFHENYKDVPTVEAKFRGRLLEVCATMFGHTKDAIKLKTDIQFKKIEQRLENANFRMKDKDPDNQSPAQRSSSTTNIVFTGSREDMFRAMRELGTGTVDLNSSTVRENDQ